MSFIQRDMYTCGPLRDKYQREVIMLDQGFHLVLASAGCGKTHILAERVNRAIANGVTPDDMLCLTFTNRAARGMKDRVAAIVGDASKDLFIGNVHRFCSKFVFENNIVSQTSSIIDEDEIFSIVNSLTSYLSDNKDIDLSDVDFEARARFKALIQIQHLMCQYRLGHPKEVIINNTSDYLNKEHNKRFFSPNLFALICKDFGKDVSIASLLEIYDQSENFSQIKDLNIQVRDLLLLLSAARKYERYKEENNLVDFDDLLILTYSALRLNSKQYKKYSWIQVDEIQDLNVLQLSIIDLLTAPDNVTIYLGDEQQAIFSFIGARLSVLEKIKNKCGNGNIHHLEKCYRSPKYLLDIFNGYAQNELGTDPLFLPVPVNDSIPEYGDLKMIYARTSESAPACAVKTTLSYKDGKTAILVSSNNEADKISGFLGDIPHFKISGEDFFSSEQVKLIFSHLTVIYDDINYLAWARLLYHLNVIKSFSISRNLLMKMKQAALSPADFILYEDSSYVLEFIKTWETQDIVVFDTETTGLDVYNDDIVQIAANKYRKGELIESLNIILETEKEIPEKLGQLNNPLIEEYNRREHCGRAAGLREFLNFARGCSIFGHNVEYDLNILYYNCIREFGDKNPCFKFKNSYDTLKLSKLLFPKLHNYKLGALIDHFNLDGENSHLADADIVATYNLALLLYEVAKNKEDNVRNILRNYKTVFDPLKQKYKELYISAIDSLHSVSDSTYSPLVKEISRSYKYFQNIGMQANSKMKYLKSFLANQVVEISSNDSLHKELSQYLVDLNTFKEADLCDNEIIEEQIFVATVHKAKGLEFDNVIVYGCVDGTYPFFASQYDPESRQEDARKLYVAISRAKKRLCLLAYDEKIVKNKKGQTYRFPATPSPFIGHIMNTNNFITLREGVDDLS